MKQILIKTSSSSKCLVIFGDFLQSIEKFTNNRKYIFLVDNNVYSIYSFLFEGKEAIVVKGEESNKNLETIKDILTQFLERKIDRHFLVVGIGGGVICDITGFVASTYMRGLEFGFVPTTLLAQVDASVGGKNGVNFNNIKNLIGTITQPTFVICDINFLKSLPFEEVINGMAEVIKMALITDRKLFSFLNSRVKEILNLEIQAIEHIAEISIKQKAKIISIDEKDRWHRHLLNFGHTIGHALEKLTALKHGFAISQGMVFNAFLSLKFNMIEKNQFCEILHLLQKYNLPIQISTDKERLKEEIFYDKKRKGDIINEILLSDIGKAKIVNLSFKELESAIDDLYKYST